MCFNSLAFTHTTLSREAHAAFKQKCVAIGLATIRVPTTLKCGFPRSTHSGQAKMCCNRPRIYSCANHIQTWFKMLLFPSTTLSREAHTAVKQTCVAIGLTTIRASLHVNVIQNDLVSYSHVWPRGEHWHKPQGRAESFIKKWHRLTP